MFAISEEDMELGSSLEDLAAVRVIIVPLGRTTQARFEKLADLISEVSEIPPRELPRRLLDAVDVQAVGASKHRGSLQSITSFGKSKKEKHHTTNSKTAAAFEKINEADEESRHKIRIKYEKVGWSGGKVVLPQASEWEGFRASLRIWGAIGILDLCDEVGIDTDQEAQKVFQEARYEFFSLMTQSRSLSTARCLVFSSPETVSRLGHFLSDTDDPANAQAAREKSSVTFGAVPYRDDHERQVVVQEIYAQVKHVAGMIMRSLENQLRLQTQTTGPLLSPLDMMRSAENQAALKHRRQGRMDKCAGDLLLLMACPELARSKFESAAEKTRNNTDRLWLASSLEGFVAAALASDTSDETIELVISKSQEVFKLYSKKKVTELEVAAAMKLAVSLSNLPHRRLKVIESARYAAQNGQTLKPTRKQKALLSQIVKLMINIESSRHAALYLYQLSRLNAESRNWRDSHNLCLEVITLLENRASDKKGRRADAAEAIAWATMKRSLYIKAAYAAGEIADERSVSFCLINALRLSAHTQSHIGDNDWNVLTRLNSLMSPIHKIPSNGMSSFIRFLDVDTMSPSSKVTWETAKKQGTSDGLFIVRLPKAPTGETVPVATWIQCEPLAVPFVLENLVRSDLEIRVVSLIVIPDKAANAKLPADQPEASSASEDVDDAAESSQSSVVRVKPRNVVLPGMTSNDVGGRVKFDVECTALERGQYQIVGISVIAFRSCLMHLRLWPRCRSDRVMIVPPLSVLEISFELETGSTPICSNRTEVHFHVYNGEAQKLRVKLRNAGNVEVTNIIAMLSPEDTADSPRRVGQAPSLMKHEVEALDVGKDSSFEISLGEADARDETSGAMTFTFTANHSAAGCNGVRRETKRTLHLHYHHGVVLRDVDFVHLPEGTVAAILDVHNAMSSVVELLPTHLSDGDKQSLECESETPTVLDPLCNGSLVVKLRSFSKPENLRVSFRWNAFVIGRQGTVTFPLRTDGLPWPDFQLRMWVDGKQRAESVVLAEVGQFHKFYLHYGANAAVFQPEDKAVLDLEISADSEVDQGTEDRMVIVGAMEGIAFPANAAREHVVKVMFTTPGEFRFNATLRCSGKAHLWSWRLYVSD